VAAHTLGVSDLLAFGQFDVRLDEIVEELLICAHKISFALVESAERPASLHLLAERKLLFVLHYMK